MVNKLHNVIARMDLDEIEAQRFTMPLEIKAGNWSLHEMWHQKTWG